DQKRRQLITETEQLRAKRNETSKQIAELKREKKDATKVIHEMREVSEQIKDYDEKLAKIEEQLKHIMLSIPNVAHESVPIGEDEEDNAINETWGKFQNSLLIRSHIGI